MSKTIQEFTSQLQELTSQLHEVTSQKTIIEKCIYLIRNDLAKSLRIKYPYVWVRVCTPKQLGRRCVEYNDEVFIDEDTCRKSCHDDWTINRIDWSDSCKKMMSSKISIEKIISIRY
jgi:hypothetical protein